MNSSGHQVVDVSLILVLLILSLICDWTILDKLKDEKIRLRKGLVEDMYIYTCRV